MFVRKYLPFSAFTYSLQYIAELKGLFITVLISSHSKIENSKVSLYFLSRKINLPKCVVLRRFHILIKAVKLSTW